MARQARRPVDGGVYHVLNRGNCRMDIFRKPEDFAAFVELLEQGRERHGMRILGYCLMDNHWHMILWPRRGADLSRFLGWVCTTHVRRWREYRRSTGQGHLYQGRFKGFLVQKDEHLLQVMRYVEANPLRAKMVRKAQAWPWSSLGREPGADGVRVQLCAWPVPRPGGWRAWVNAALDGEALDRLRLSVVRNRPFGDDRWTKRVAKRYGLESTMRDPWRPKGSKQPAKRRPER
jgi:putative transposase